MKLLVLYRPNSDHGRMVEEFIHNYKDRNSGGVEALNIDSREGIAMATLYDIMDYPAILALRADGFVQKIWQGQELPLMDEVASYANA